VIQRRANREASLL